MPLAVARLALDPIAHEAMRGGGQTATRSPGRIATLVAGGMSGTDDLLRNNEAFAEGFASGGLQAAPAKRVAVLSCMDARVIPSRILGLEPGDAHIVKNAGGVVTDDAIRSLAISQHLLGTEEIVLIHHTDCGMLGFTDDELESKLESETGERPSWRGGAFSDLEQDLRDSIQALRASPFIPRKDSIRGFVYDVETGRLAEVAP
jgi:carbonic anhydrase